MRHDIKKSLDNNELISLFSAIVLNSINTKENCVKGFLWQSIWNKLSLCINYLFKTAKLETQKRGLILSC